jgi:hypothetical protein
MQILPAGFSAITMHSLVAWIWALVWAALVFTAIAGYGAALLRALGVRRATPVLASLAGLGVTVFLGGLLNAARLITVPVALGFVVLGVVAAVVLVRREPATEATVAPVKFAQKSLTAKLLLSATVLVFAFRIAASVHDCQLQDSDDFNYYLAAPLKILQTHSFRGDVFSERRVMSSIGGNEFLDTLILATQPAECAQMGDWMLGVFLLALLAAAIGREFDLTEEQRYALAFFIAITPQLRFNLTFVVLPSAIFTGLVYVAAHRELTARQPLVQALLLGSTVGAVASMKSSYVVHGVLFLACIMLLRWWRHGFTGALRFAIPAAIACVAVMLPWMAANHATAGTWFYPLLGKGFQYAAYGHYPPPTNPALGILFRKVIPFCVPLMVVLAAELYWGEREERALTVTALMLTALLGSLANGVATGGDSVRRYNYPCILPAITLAYIVFARRKMLAPTVRKWRMLETAAAAFAVLAAINTGTTNFTSEYRDSWRELKASLTDYRATTAATRAQYAALEEAIPAGSTALTSVLDPFLLDFRKSNILIADWPGAASPRPGWPLWESADSFAQFLLAHNVRYLIYGYNDCNLTAEFPDCHTALDKSQSEKRANTNLTQWVREEAAVGYDARHQYEELGRTRRRIYDDGKIFILDLTQPAAN